MIISLIAAVVIIMIVTIYNVFVKTPEEKDNTCHNPMCWLYETYPNFQQYTFGDSDQAYENEFWKD